MAKRKRKPAGKRPGLLRALGVDSSGLSALECRFLHAYLAGPPGIRGNAVASAHRAGLSAKNNAAGTNLTSRPHVRAAIAQHFAKLNITTERVLGEIAKIAFSDMRDYAKWGPEGVRLEDSAGLPDDAAAAVAEVSEHEVTGEKSSSRSVRFKLHDKVTALTNLGKYLKLFTERTEVTGKDGGPIQHEHGFDLRRLTVQQLELLREIREQAQTELAVVPMRALPPASNGNQNGPQR